MNSNYCVCCGEEIPEGMQVCTRCINAAFKDENKNSDTQINYNHTIHNIWIGKKENDNYEYNRSV